MICVPAFVENLRLERFLLLWKSSFGESRAQKTGAPLARN